MTEIRMILRCLTFNALVPQLLTNKENDLFDVNKTNKNDNITNKKIHLFDVNNNKRIDIFDEMDDDYK